MSEEKRAVDFEHVRAATRGRILDLLRRWYPDGAVEGQYFRVDSPDGGRGRAVSVAIATGYWKDHRSDEGGDLIALYAALTGKGAREAAIEIADQLGVEAHPGARDYGAKPKPSGATKTDPRPAPPPREAGDPTPEIWTPKRPDKTVEIPFPPLHPKLKAPDAIYRYLDAGGRTLFMVCRWNLPDKKIVLPLSYGELDGVLGWHWKGWTRKRPLYRLLDLKAKPDAPVLIVEGEKAADSAAKLLADLWGGVVLTWAGGSSATKQTDWRPLAGRHVVIWPDADPPGRKVARELAAALSAAAIGAASIRIVEPAEDLPKGWDLADVDPAAGQTAGWAVAEIEAAGEYDPDLESDSGTPDPALPAPSDDCPFVPVGHRAGTYYVFSPAGELRGISFSRLNGAGLESLVNGKAEWFFRHFPAKAREGANVYNVDAARRWLMRACAAEGLFDEHTPIMGPGVWPGDDGGALVHVGDQLFEGRAWRPAGVKRSGALLPARPKIGRPDFANPATVAEARELQTMLQLWRFREGFGPDVILGFIGAGCLGAAIDWRAHVYCLAANGSGKSWLCELIGLAMGGASHPAATDYSEAGLRQSLSEHARAMILDEAERGDGAGRGIETVIRLIRHMSSGAGARTMRGSAGGEARTFRVVGACFLAAIIGGRLLPQDQARITTINLDKLPAGSLGAEAHRMAIAAKARAAELAPRLWARMILSLDRFRDNFEAYREAWLSVGASQREGDQLGTLFAGRETLINDGVADVLAARETVAYFLDLLSDGERRESTNEGQECLDYLLTQPCELVRSGRLETYAALILDGLETNGLLARETLERAGLKLVKDPTNIGQRDLLIANKGGALDRVFQNTQWREGGWATALRYLDGARAGGSPARFSGVHMRYTVIPAGYLPMREPPESSDDVNEAAVAQGDQI